MAEKIPGWIEPLLLPRLGSLEGEMKAIRGEFVGEFKTVRGELEALRAEFLGEFKAVRGELRALNEGVDSVEKQISSLRSETMTRFEALESKVTLIEDVTRLK